MQLCYSPPHPVDDGPGMSHYVGQAVRVLHETPERVLVHGHDHFTITETHAATVTVEFPGGMIRDLPASHFTAWVEPPITPPVDRPRVEVEPGGPVIRVRMEWSATVKLPLNEIIAHYPAEWSDELDRAGGDVRRALRSFAEEWADGDTSDPDFVDVDVDLPKDDEIDEWRRRMVDRLTAHYGTVGAGPAADPYLYGGAVA